MKQVMIVDDSRFMREDIVHLLEGSAFAPAHCCRDAEEALELYGENEVDVVLMDIVLPGMDGLEATKALAKKGARVVIISSLGYDDTIKSARTSGAASFLIKPFTKEQLLHVLQEVSK